MPRSLKVAPEYIDKVKAALLRNGFPRQQDLAEAEGLRKADGSPLSRDTINKFLNGKPVSFLNFTEICRVLALNWEEIADFGDKRENPQPSASVNSLESRFLSHAGLSDTQSTPQEVEPPSPEISPFLFELILQIDFKEQSRRFKDVIKCHHAAGFLVHGERGCGQRFLVNRLLRLKRGWQNQSPIKIDIYHNGVGRSIPNLWRELTSWLGLPRDAQAGEIMDRVCQRSQTQDVIFTFYTVDYMLPGMLAAWLQEFWEPLVARATENMPKRHTHLLMFLVDNCGSIAKSDLSLAETFEQPRYPLRLPAASLFPFEELDAWLDNQRMLNQVQISAELTAPILLERSNNGIPQYVYEEICKHCGLSWEGVLLKKWEDHLRYLKQE